MTNDDNSIIERIRGGETSEFAQLVKRYGPSLMVFVGRIVGVQEDTEPAEGICLNLAPTHCLSRSALPSAEAKTASHAAA